MKTELGNLWALVYNAQQSAGKESALTALQNLKLRMPAGYYLARKLAVVNTEGALVETKRNELIQKYGTRVLTPNEVGESVASGQWYVSPEQLDAFADEWNALCKTEIELPGEPLTLDDLSNADLTAEQIAQINFLIAPPDAASNAEPKAKNRGKLRVA